MSSPLSPGRARETLGTLGRLLYDTDVSTFWERDSATLARRHRQARQRYRDFAQRHLAPRALEADRAVSDDEIRALFLAAAAEGLQTEQLPKPWGSARLRSFGHGILWPAVLKAEEMTAACGGLGLALLAHDLGTAPLMICGEPRALGWLRHIYREIESGEPAVAAFAITEPGAGSDVEDTDGAASATLSARARRVSGGYRLSGQKCFISGGRVARWITLFATLEDEGIESWTCFLLDKSMEGLTVGRSERKLGQRASDASEILLDEVFVPDDRVIGGPRTGWALNRNVLNYSRPAVGAIAVGIARSAFEHSLAFCRAARLRGKPLIAHQDVQLVLAEMLIQIQAARALVWQTARYGRPFQAAGAAPKAFAATVAWQVSTRAMELLGDHGYVHGQAVEKAARDARLTLIYEGTHQINLLAIVEGQAGAEFPVLD